MDFNLIVEKISKSESINSTLFFSKKAQKDFLRLIYAQGLDTALNELTNWRLALIKDDLVRLLR